ncbi:hypothetical protein DKP76_15125 [Falsochrobactrum shanghaiense]|uniref:Uncharacterized protein n=1 Tax=Falsochrobactrum shanghaiense TaxID=2201899 RepID=A0A316J6A2_9HYPH|nr:hypothetical protein DKP76_15125 [Falsochrobactrum shanghaiense]
MLKAAKSKQHKKIKFFRTFPAKARLCKEAGLFVDAASSIWARTVLSWRFSTKENLSGMMEPDGSSRVLLSTSSNTGHFERGFVLGRSTYFRAL